MTARRSPAWNVIAAAWLPVVFGLAVWLALPDMVVAVDDDFGYLRSVQESWQRGRLWTHEFLVPHAAGTTALACLIFAATGSMVCAVHGSLTLTATAASAAMLAFLRAVNVPRFAGWIVAGLMLAMPTLMFMWLNFTSLPLFWACQWLAAWAALKNRWGLFTLAVVVAMATRQSALMWLGLPGWVVLVTAWQGWRRTGRLELVKGALVAGIVGWAVFFALKAGMNLTAAQQHYHAVLGQLQGAGRLAWIGPAALLCGGGWACWMQGLREGRQVSWLRLTLAVVAAVAGAWLANAALDRLDVSHRSYSDHWRFPMLALFGGAGASGLVLFPRVPWGAALAAGLAATLPQWLYVSGFDYYYVESFFWGFIAAAAGKMWPSAGREPRGVPGWLPATTALLMALALAAWNGRTWVLHRLMQDRVAAYCRLYEAALRSGRLSPQHIGRAPFGYCGWRLDLHYFAHIDTTPAGFMNLTEGWDDKDGSGVLTTYPKWMRGQRAWFPTLNSRSLAMHPDAKVIEKIESPVLWFWSATFELRRVPPPALRPGQFFLDPALHVPQPFPLDDAEWRRLMAGDASLGLATQASPIAPAPPMSPATAQ